MKTRCPFLLAPVLLAIAFASPQASSQIISGNVVGYVNLLFRPGYTLFGNPLDAPTNRVSMLFPTAPEGAAISLWSSSSMAYNQTATYSAGRWSADLTLAPGTGARLYTTSAFTNTFVGTVLAPDGSPFNPEGPVSPPPVFGGPDGLYLLASKFPAVLNATNFPVFQYILGRGPHEGEQFIRFDAVSQTSQTTTFLSGSWDNGDPVLGVGEAAFFNIGPVVVPEPATLSLSLLGVAALAWTRRRGRGT